MCTITIKLQYSQLIGQNMISITHVQNDKSIRYSKKKKKKKIKIKYTNKKKKNIQKNIKQ